ncbi:hypothetical protein GXP67_28230 [Rhodocytophaga rosea]|uniref:Uncharacterized protein n=1 Tax=Rhodocytophaga rosea TaxID=2704465 RepID=A0A6C0GQC6_9BACT|nr:hypothetical protein [Rhodocytophaga rosea]QHT70261.1 hypothetical protein GXP67_28230 [Rhodocytophaga rosea]
MNSQQYIEITTLVQRLAKLIGHSQAQAYYERVYGDATLMTRYSYDYVKEKMNHRIVGETLKETY